jgi:predicted nucleotidyltransferase
LERLRLRKTFGLEEPLREAVTALSAPIRLAAIYGSVAKGLETSSSDVDILIVSDELTLEEVYSVMDSVESSLSRQVNPTLYTNAEFERKRTKTSSFLAKVLSGPLIVLAGAIDAA